MLGESANQQQIMVPADIWVNRDNGDVHVITKM
jgi:hypothetical protein